MHASLQAMRSRAMLEQFRLNIVAPRFLANARFSERQVHMHARTFVCVFHGA